MNIAEFLLPGMPGSENLTGQVIFCRQSLPSYHNLGKYVNLNKPSTN